MGLVLGIYPEHLGPELMKIYKSEIVDVRMAEKAKPKDQRDELIIKGYKKAANCIYGKSNEAKSMFYDPLYTLRTTIGGQMFISMWTEKLIKAIPEIRFLTHNTDGICYMVPRSKFKLAKSTTEEWCKEVGLSVETETYSKLVLKDVNNYIAQYTNGKLKEKGCFDTDPEINKDHSMMIVPIALREYFINGIPIADTIKNCKNIYDFCLRLKLNSTSRGFFRSIDKEKRELIEIPLTRTTRYYISNSGGSLSKSYESSKKSGVNVGYNATLFNNFEEKPFEEYDVNYNFYIAEANKIKHVIDSNQLSLFEW